MRFGGLTAVDAVSAAFAPASWSASSARTAPARRPSSTRCRASARRPRASCTRSAGASPAPRRTASRSRASPAPSRRRASSPRCRSPPTSTSACSSPAAARAAPGAAAATRRASSTLLGLGAQTRAWRPGRSRRRSSGCSRSAWRWRRGRSVLLLDEVAAGLTENEVEAMARLIRRLRDELGLTVVWIEHAVRTLLAHVERVIVLHQGRKIADGTPADVVRDRAGRRRLPRRRDGGGGVTRRATRSRVAAAAQLRVEGLGAGYGGFLVLRDLDARGAAGPDRDRRRQRRRQDDADAGDRRPDRAPGRVVARRRRDPARRDDVEHRRGAASSWCRGPSSVRAG